MGFNKRAQWSTTQSCNSMFINNEWVAGWILIKSGCINSFFFFAKMQKKHNDSHPSIWWNAFKEFGILCNTANWTGHHRKHVQSGGMHSVSPIPTRLIRFIHSQVSELATAETFLVMRLYKLQCTAAWYSLPKKTIQIGNVKAISSDPAAGLLLRWKASYQMCEYNLSDAKEIHWRLSASLAFSQDWLCCLFYFLRISLTEDVCVGVAGLESREWFVLQKKKKKKKNLTKTFPIYWLSIQPHVQISIFLRWTLTAHNVRRESQQFRRRCSRSMPDQFQELL